MDQTTSPDLYEVIVVNNNSTDSTQKVAELFAGQHPNIRLVFEPSQGLGHARNRGWQEAKADWVAYIDDDCRVPRHWLELGREIIDDHSPAVFGGPYYPFYNSPKPSWFKDEYGSHVLDNQARPLKIGEYLDGGNIFFSRMVLETMGGFDAGLGMSGDAIAYGEETYLLRRIRTVMPDKLIYYDPRLYVYHLVPLKKMSLSWIIQQRFFSGCYSYRILQDNNPRSPGPYIILKRSIITLLYLCFDLTLGFLRYDRTRYPFIQNYFYECVSRHIQTVGALYEQYRSLRTKHTSKIRITY